MERDPVDLILEQWRRERPDVDLSGMAIIGRISRVERRLQTRLNEVFAHHGLEAWEFDVLATLRRTGPPYRLTAGQLLDSMMITSGAVTHRINRLEARGLIRREPDPHDGRVVHVVLTDDGFRTIEAALPDHAANEATIVAALGERDRATLTRLLRRLHVALDRDEG
jgi:DNA-binding MarR family transcriptional regulator